MHTVSAQPCTAYEPPLIWLTREVWRAWGFRRDSYTWCFARSCAGSVGSGNGVFRGIVMHPQTPVPIPTKIRKPAVVHLGAGREAPPGEPQSGNRWGKCRTFRRDLRLYAKEEERASTCPTELATSCRTGASRRLRMGVQAVSGSCRRAGLTSAATPASSARPVAAATCGLARGSAGDSRSGSKRRENLSVGGARRTSQSNAPVCVIAERRLTDYRYGCPAWQRRTYGERSIEVNRG